MEKKLFSPKSIVIYIIIKYNLLRLIRLDICKTIDMIIVIRFLKQIMYVMCKVNLTDACALLLSFRVK